MAVDEDETPVPKREHLKRIASKNSRIEDLEGQLKALQAKLADVPDVGKLERRLARITEERDQAVQGLVEFKAQATQREALLGAGVTDPEDQELVTWRWERLPEDKRPTLAEYVAGQAREDRHLRHLWPQEPPQEAQEAQEAQGGTQAAQGGPQGSQEAYVGPRGPRASLPAVQNGVKAQAAPPKALSLEAILAMPVEERVRPENRERIAAALRGD